MSEFTLSSPAFDDGDRIPEEYGYEQSNVNPPLTIDGVPEEADALALVVEDPDAREAEGESWDHWVIWNIPPDTTEIPEDWSSDDAVEGQNDYGEPGYGGPKPPEGEHTYEFHLYALSTRLDLSSNADSEDLEHEMAPHVLAEAELTGTYSA